jgi:hypothetical protein
MDKNDLKDMWHDAHITFQDTFYDKVSIEKSITKNHCKTISKILWDIKLKILVYTMILIIYFGLIIYAFVYLGLDLTLYSLVPLTFSGLFLLAKTTSEFIRLLILAKTADNMSVKESSLFFHKKLDRIRTIDFISYLVFLYLFAILIVYGYLKDIGGFRNLSWTNEILPVPILGIFILMLLIIPWLIKYQHNQRYKNIYLNLNKSASILDSDA